MMAAILCLSSPDAGRSVMFDYLCSFVCSFVRW